MRGEWDGRPDGRPEGDWKATGRRLEGDWKATGRRLERHGFAWQGWRPCVLTTRSE